MEELTTQKKTEYNLQLLNEYLTHLKQRFKELEKEPFSTKARIKLNQEIENITSLVEEEQMEKTWNNLNVVFNTEATKPDFREAPSKFRDSMTESNKPEQWLY